MLQLSHPRPISILQSHINTPPQQQQQNLTIINQTQQHQQQEQPYYYHQQQQQQQQQQQPQSQSRYHNLFNSTVDSYRDYQQPARQYSQNSPQSLMQSEHSNNSWFSNGPLTPTSTTRAHHRESSLSSLGSAGPASPYTANLSTSNPDIYHDYHDYPQPSSKPLTPAHTPSQEHFLAPHYSSFYHNSHLPFGMAQDASKGNPELMAAPEFTHSAKPSIASVATSDSPNTPPSYEEERNKNVYRNGIPKLDRTMTDIYADELYIPNYEQITSAAQTSIPAPTVTVSPLNDVFSQRLQAANNQHLSASNTQAPLAIPARERSPFRQGSPLAPTGNNFSPQSPNVRFGTATHMREQQKAEADARALQHQISRQSPNGNPPNTISPKDVNLVYTESEEDANTPLFPPQRQSPTYRAQATMVREQTEGDDNISQRSFGSMATTRRESSSAYSTTSQATPQQSTFNFTPPSVPGGLGRIPQQYPFVPQSRRQASNLSNVTEDFPSTLTSMESSSSEYAPELSERKKPLGAAADTGTYTCTYHGCTLRFDTPAKLQRHKREGHRNSASVISGGDEGGMTSAAQRNSQAGPHKCERINPSTGKPCNTIFSRPYDLTRHEDTIHNARKQKVHCPICTEEKTFSRNDALTRHMRVVHPQYADQHGRRRRAGS